MPSNKPTTRQDTSAGTPVDPNPPIKRNANDLFSRVTVSRASQVIVDQIRDLIREGKLTPGDRLPSERDLCGRFGVSRVTIREALRVLEASGLVDIRVGARGGAFVTSPSNEQVGKGLADLLTLSAVTAPEVTEARMVFELGIMPLVVERATQDDTSALRALVDAGRRALEDDTYTMAMSATFHARVAACTHNTAIEMLVQSFHGPLLMSLKEAQVVAPLMGHRGTDEHSELVDAIEQRDLEKAQSIMLTHIERTAERVAQADAGATAER